MAKQTINVGSAANDGTGDTLRTAGQKVNSNFTEVYDTSQAAFNVANTANTGLNNLSPQVSSAWNTANAAYNVANTAAATNIDPWARTQANAAFAKANTANYRSIVTINTAGISYLNSTSDIILCDPVAANDNITIVLPNTPNSGQVVTVKNITNGANDVFIQSTGSQKMELLNGTVGTGLYEALPQIGHAITWVWDENGSAWRIINAFV